MNSRIDEVKKLARRARCTHVLVTDPVDVEYISGFRSSNAFLLISRHAHLLFTDFRYFDAARNFCRKKPVWQFEKSGEDGFSALAPHLQRTSCVGVQSDTLSVDRFDMLRKQCAPARLLKLGESVSKISIVKQRHEIAAMKRAARIGDRAFSLFIKKLAPGTTEIQAAELLESLCKDSGSQGPSFPTIVLFGARASLPHGRPSSRKLRNGDWILCDFGCTIQGFCSDMTRTAVLGAASKKQKEIYDIVYRAQSAAREKICAGMQAKQVDAIARDIIAASGYGEAFGHATGHGVGLRIHEKPRIGRRDSTILRENMVVTIEPGIYIVNQGGVRIEDLVVVKQGACQCLTRAPRKLIEIGK